MWKINIYFRTKKEQKKKKQKHKRSSQGKKGALKAKEKFHPTQNRSLQEQESSDGEVSSCQRLYFLSYIRYKPSHQNPT